MSSNSPTTAEATRTARAAQASRRVVGDHPLPSALTAFGLGVGVGLLIAAMVPGSARQRDETLAERISHQVLGALSHVLPDAIAQRLS